MSLKARSVVHAAVDRRECGLLLNDVWQLDSAHTDEVGIKLESHEGSPHIDVPISECRSHSTYIFV